MTTKPIISDGGSPGTPAGYSIVNRLYKKALTLDYSGDIVTCTDAGAANQRWELTPVMTL